MEISEVHNEFIDDDNLCHIDIYPIDEEAEGKTVAVVDLDTNKVIFFDNTCRNNELVKTAIEEVVNNNKFRVEENLKRMLEKLGYQTQNLWCVNDVKPKYKCDDETALDVLYKALTNDCTMEQIWRAIDIVASEQYNLEESDNLYNAGVEFLGVDIIMDGDHTNTQIDLGELTLEFEDREYKLDCISSTRSFENGATTIRVEVSVDKDTFSDCDYDLEVADLYSNGLNASLYFKCDEEWEYATLFIRKNESTKAIDLKLDE